MRRLWKRGIIVAATVLAVGAIIIIWQQRQPTAESRRNALQSLSRFASTLESMHNSELLDMVFIPVAIQDRTPAEQQEFLDKALKDEISPAGVLALKRHAEFGDLKSVFPKEAAAWCRQAGVNADDCVAFKMEHDGIRAEVVLLREGETYRVVRCNNVKQMAMNFNHG